MNTNNEPNNTPKNPAAQALGRAGGAARAARLTTERKREIATLGGKGRDKKNPRDNTRIAHCPYTGEQKYLKELPIGWQWGKKPKA